MVEDLTKFKLKKIENERLALLSNWTVEDVNYDDWINHNDRISQKLLESRAFCSAIGYELEQLDDKKRKLLAAHRQ